MGRTYLPTVVIGGGQAGLVMGYHLRRSGEPFVILEAGARTGDAWRSRWDTLRLFSLPRYASLPGLPIGTTTYPTRDEIADYLETYAARFALPIRHSTRVRRLTRAGSMFMIDTDHDTIAADRVVVATGGHAEPLRPDFAGELDPEIQQLDSRDYRHSTEFAGEVLVVGAGTAGSDIAVDLARSGRRAVLAGPHPGEIPVGLDSPLVRALMPAIMFTFLHVFTLGNPLGRHLHHRMRQRGTPLIRYRRRDITAAGVERVGWIAGVADGLPQVEDGRVLHPRTVIWCTGFAPDHSWIELPIFGPDGLVRHRRGLVPDVPGLYFLGLSFQHGIASAALLGIDLDARYLLRDMRRSRTRSAVRRGRGSPPASVRRACGPASTR